MSSSDYKSAYESAKKELADLIAAQDKMAKRVLVLRESLKMLGTLCESEDIAVEPSAEADYLLAHATLSQDIRGVLQSEFPESQRPHEIKAKLERLGHDLSKYRNPQAAIHMVLKRMVESGEAREEQSTDGKQVYRRASIAEALGVAPENVIRVRGSKAFTGAFPKGPMKKRYGQK